MVLIRITRMLRGWISMFKQEVGALLEGMIVQLEELSRRPEQNCQAGWRRSLSSQLVPLGVQSLAYVRSDFDVAESLVMSKWARLFCF
jgi:hypothetical protein